MFDWSKYLSTAFCLCFCLITVYCKLHKCVDIQVYGKKAFDSLDNSCTCNQSSKNNIYLIECSEKWNSQPFTIEINAEKMIVNGSHGTIPFKFIEEFVPLVLSKMATIFKSLEISHFCNDASTGNQLDLSNLVTDDDRNTTQIKMPYNCLQSITSSRNEIGHFEQLDFSFNKLTQIPKLSYNMYKLSNYDLSHNSIETISNTDFDITECVKFVNLSHNNLRLLPQNVLNNLQWLIDLDMSYNELTKLPKYIFRQSYELEVINLSHNRIKHVDLEFGIVCPLKVLRLESNDIIDFNIDGAGCSNNPKIILSHNNISHVHVRLSYNHISHVNFSHNNITHVNLTELELQTIYRDKKIHLDFSFNPFVCDCKLNKFIKYLKRNQTETLLTFHDENNICSSPSNLNGTPLVSIDDNLSCNYSKNCPKSCHCTIDDIDNIAFVSIDCANSNLTHFPNIASYGSSSVDIQLDLSRNAISSLPSKSHPMWTRIKKLDLSHNRIDSLENMTDLSILTTLYLNDNSFREFDPRQLQVGRVKLANNPWECNCVMSILVLQSSSIEDKNRMTCVKNETIMYNFTNVDQICSDNSIVYANFTQIETIYEDKKILLVVILPIVVIVILISVIVILFIKYKSEIVYYMFSKGICLKFVSEDDIDADKVYDAFVSYSGEDEDWIRDFLVPGLEARNPKYNLCLHNRDWLAGEFITDQIVKSVQTSRRTIIVLTDNYLKSPWSRLEFDLAYQQGLKDQVRRVMVIVPNEVPDLSQIDATFKTFISLTTYIQANKPHFWSKLRASMPRTSTQNKRKSSTLRKSVYLNSDSSQNLHHEEVVTTTSKCETNMTIV
uniref:TIR domain-containing protein n=1 Tax=Strigamia maritima TaxID=126957 RepID=T1INM7_STRMM